MSDLDVVAKRGIGCLGTEMVLNVVRLPFRHKISSNFPVVVA